MDHLGKCHPSLIVNHNHIQRIFLSLFYEGEAATEHKAGFQLLVDGQDGFWEKSA
ncbi:hypothetical protein HPP92_012600 [Vanilla planifolia]|uniref:Uncharacterized protein n=1 Tax=Vanilla planifolia TaxID=51239 RepID=A0A835UZU0_VANPL|nr:hypothetical protein HPP92_012600 [Vanilla planifolia]